jgi:hypothetical protein
MKIMVLQMRQLLATLCVASSLTLVTLDASNRPSGCHLKTLSFGIPLSHREAHWGYDFRIMCCHSWRDVRGVGEACKLSLPSPLLHLRGPNHFFPLVVILRGY